MILHYASESEITKLDILPISGIEDASVVCNLIICDHFGLVAYVKVFSEKKNKIKCIYIYFVKLDCKLETALYKITLKKAFVQKCFSAKAIPQKGWQ